jgi:8-oxo-dGTP diphosphatase
MHVRKFTGRTATAIIPFPDNNILLIKRKTVPFIGYWALPGGRMDPGETVEETLVREVKEETGLDVTVIRKVGEYHEKGIQQGIAYDYYPACFLVKPLNNTTRKQDSEIEEIRLFSLTELPEKLAFEHTSMIKDFLNQKQTNLE